MNDHLVFKHGKDAGYRGDPLCDNPYRKGIPGMSTTIDYLAQTWENGHFSGKKQKLIDTMFQHMECLRGGLNTHSTD